MKYEMKMVYTFELEFDPSLSVTQVVAQINELIEDEAELMTTCQTDCKITSLRLVSE